MNKLTVRSPFGRTGLQMPPIVFGTSCLGNLYRALDDSVKLGIAREWFACVEPPVALDSAGKYGAGLALEVIGKVLRELGVRPDRVVISNKLGWLRTPLTGPEPTFEPGAWANLEHDARQDISGPGILRCWEQGCELLGGDYRPRLVSVHDPDEYLAGATSADDRKRRFDDVVEAYGALHDLKAKGEIAGVGVGSKDWRVIRDLWDAVELDWVMLACSLTVYTHPRELVEFVDRLTAANVGIINSAVYNAGFLTGGNYFDYRIPDRENPDDRGLFEWRDRFNELCARHGVDAAEACVRFGMSPPGVSAIALNTSKPERVADNVRAVTARIPDGFWAEMKQAGLVAADYPYAGV